MSKVFSLGNDNIARTIIYCPIIPLRGGEGGGENPVPLEYFGEENLYPRNFPYFWA